MTDTIVHKWIDLAALRVLLGEGADKIGYQSRYYHRYISLGTIEFDLDTDGATVTIRKRGKGLLARYQIISHPSL